MDKETSQQKAKTVEKKSFVRGGKDARAAICEHQPPPHWSGLVLSASLKAEDPKSVEDGFWALDNKLFVY